MGFGKLRSVTKEIKLKNFFVPPKKFVNQQKPILLTPKEQIEHQYGPLIYCFKNKRDGSLTYNTIPLLEPKLVRKISYDLYHTQELPIYARADYWDLFYVAKFKNYATSTEVFKNILKLKEMRSVLLKRENKEIRKSNSDADKGIFKDGEFNPFYQQEGVADLIESIHKSQFFNSGELDNQTTIYWDNIHAKGDLEKFWNPKIPSGVIEHIPLKEVHEKVEVVVSEINDDAVATWNQENEPEFIFEK